MCEDTEISTIYIMGVILDETGICIKHHILHAPTMPTGTITCNYLHKALQLLVWIILHWEFTQPTQQLYLIIQSLYIVRKIITQEKKCKLCQHLACLEVFLMGGKSCIDSQVIHSVCFIAWRKMGKKESQTLQNQLKKLKHL